MEKYTASVLKAEVNLELDLFQFANREGRGADDTANSVINLAVKHLEEAKTSAY